MPHYGSSCACILIASCNCMSVNIGLVGHVNISDCRHHIGKLQNYCNAVNTAQCVCDVLRPHVYIASCLQCGTCPSERPFEISALKLKLQLGKALTTVLKAGGFQSATQVSSSSPLPSKHRHGSTLADLTSEALGVRMPAFLYTHVHLVPLLSTPD